MPNDPGPSSWLAGQYQKFLQGIEQVGTDNSKRLARAQRTVTVDGGKSPRISIPAWDDVIRTGPRTTVTPEDYAISKHFRQARLPSPLDPKIEREIQHRRDVADRIRNSAIPEYQTGVGTMVTAVDNVQDATLTLAVGGRITSTALGRFGLWMAPAVAQLSRLALAMSWLGIALSYFGIAYAAACQGPRDALSQARSQALTGYLFKGLRAASPRLRGIPTPFPSAGRKGQTGAAMFGVPSGRGVANKRASRWAKAAPSFGELLQAGQVAYDQVGYGLALGAIVGMSSETAYASARLAQGERVVVRSPDVNYVMARVLGSTVAGYGRAALWHRHQCARAVASAPIILRDPEFWGDALYGLTWLTYYASLEPLMWDTQGLAWREPMVGSLQGAAWEPWDVADPVSRGILQDVGVSLTELRWPVPGAPAKLGAEYLVGGIGKEIGDALARWLDADPFDPWRRLIAETAMNTTERVWYWLEGGPDWPAWTLAPTAAVWESLFLGARWPVVSDPPERILAAWADSEEYARESDEHLIPVEVLDRIWRDAGSPLLRLTGGDGEVPADFFAPYDPDAPDRGDSSFGPDLYSARERLSELIRSRAPESL